MDPERTDDTGTAAERPYDPSPEAESGHPPEAERGADGAPTPGTGDAASAPVDDDAPADGTDPEEHPSDPAVIEADPSTAGGPSGDLPDDVERLRGG